MPACMRSGLGVSFACPEQLDRPTAAPGAQCPAPAATAGSRAVHEMRAGFHARKSARSPPLSLRHRHRRRRARRRSAGRFEWALGRAARSGARSRRGRDRARTASTTSGPSRPRRAEAALPLPHPRIGRWASGRDGRGGSFHVEADRFLHHMVRMLVGTMVDIALGRRAPGRHDHACWSAADNQRDQPAGAAAGTLLRRGRVSGGAYSSTPTRSRMRLATMRSGRAPASRGRRRGRDLGGLRAPMPAPAAHRAAPAPDAPRPRRGRVSAGRRRAARPSSPRSSAGLARGRLDQRASRGRRAPQSPWDIFFVPRAASAGPGLRHRLHRPARRRHHHQPARGRRRRADRGDARRRHRPARHACSARIRSPTSPCSGSSGRDSPSSRSGQQHRPHDRRMGRGARQPVRLPARQRRADGDRRAW